MSEETNYTLEDFEKGVQTSCNGTFYEVTVEQRENHPRLRKAVVKNVRNGVTQKIGVWKPGHESPKPGYMPLEVRKLLGRCRDRIAEFEKAQGIADY